MNDHPPPEIPNNRPCYKFVMASIVSGTSIVFGATMLVINPLSPLSPFFAGLISGGVSYWLTPPTYKNPT